MGNHSKVLLAVVLFASVWCRAGAQAGAVPQTFDVVSIHLNSNSTDGHHHIYNDSSVSRFRAVNLGLRDLIQFAYGLPASQILNGPGWMESAMFDIDAKCDAEVDQQFHVMPGAQAREAKQKMVQALLADRFGLKAHQETRQLPIYALVLAKDGPRFKVSEGSGTTVDHGRTRLHVAGGDDTVSVLARELALQLGRPVVNQTELRGRYDLSLRWSGDDDAAAAPDAPPGLFAAIQEQLGLRLESAKGPVQVLVIDRVEMPTSN